MQNVSFPQIVDQLYKTFSNEAEASQYNNTQSEAQYMGLCGWAGTMSPLNRAAFLKEFGQDVTDRAEREARARVAEYRAAYEASEYHRHEMEAGEADPDQVPAVGSFVFGWTDWLKCEGGPMDPLKNHVNDWGSLRPELVEIVAAVEVDPAEFLSAETAHRIAREHQNHGGSRYNEADPLRLDGQPYAWTVGVLLVCRPYGDGEKSQTPARWYIVDSEGFSWARYILMPQRFASMYAEEIAELRAQRAAVEAQKEAEEQAAKAARLAEYRARCARWDGAGLVDVRPLIAAEEEANKAYGWRSAEAKSAARKLAAARRRNILTMCQAAAPGVKFSVKKWDGWGGSYEVSWTDGPTEAELKAAADLDLLEEGRDTFDGMTDCAGHSRAEFIDFAAQYLCVFGEINTSRETSPEYRAEIIARIREAVPGLPEDDRQPVDESTAWTIADTFTPDTLHRYDVAEYAQRWGLSDAAALIARNTSRPTTSEAPTDPTPDNGGTGAAYGETEKSQTQEAPDGLTIEEIPGGVAVVGDSRATYKARRDIKAHGARWNKAAQRWEATDAEAVESLRQWLTPAPVALLATPEVEEQPAPVAVGAKPLQGMTFCITGKIGVRREEFGAFIERQGGTWHRNARKDTQFIIVGHTGEYGITGKLRTAIENGAQEITAEEVAALCGTTMEALRDDDTTYEAAATHHATRELRKAQRSIERQADGIAQSIRIHLQSAQHVTFAHSVPVMIEGGEVARCTSIELHRPTSNRLEYIIHTDEGEALSLDEVHRGFMGDLLDAILTAA